MTSARQGKAPRQDVWHLKDKNAIEKAEKSSENQQRSDLH
jgi:hypothetical protein